MADHFGSARSSSGGKTWPVFRSLANYRLPYLRGDLFAGLTLAAIVIPEQMATARLGGFAPQIGFFAFVARARWPLRCSAATASCRLAPIRPSRRSFAGGLCPRVAANGLAGLRDTLAAALALIVGLMLAASGIFRMGWIADLLSIPVTIGFLTGISVQTS